MTDRSISKSGFEDPPDNVEYPGDGSGENDWDRDEQEIGSNPQSKIERVKSEQEARLFAIEGVVGVGIGATEIGDDAIVVYLRAAHQKVNVPSHLAGYPVVIEVSGDIDAY